MITEQDLKFKPLPQVPYIANAVVPVNEHFRLSISYNTSHGMFWVGHEGSYEVAIQAFETVGGKGDLVFVDGGSNTVTSDCDIAAINTLFEKASRMRYVGRIDVLDTPDGPSCPAGQERWLERFYCAEGDDLREKLAYAERIWGKDRYKFIPVEPTKTPSAKYTVRDLTGKEPVRVCDTKQQAEAWVQHLWNWVPNARPVIEQYPMEEEARLTRRNSLPGGSTALSHILFI